MAKKLKYYNITNIINTNNDILPRYIEDTVIYTASIYIDHNHITTQQVNCLQSERLQNNIYPKINKEIIKSIDNCNCNLNDCRNTLTY